MAERVRAVLVGCGGIAGAWLSAIQKFDDLLIVGLVDLNLEAAQDRARGYELKETEVGTDLSEVLAKTNPDVVFDCTVPSAHLNVTITALNHGCHVLGEKPMAENLDDAQRMIEAAEKANKIFAITQTRRYIPGIRRLHHFLADDPIGKITTVHSDFFIGAHFGGFRDTMPHVLLADMAIHTFDQVRYFAGVDPVRVMFAKDWNPEGSWYEHGASAIVVFEMSDGMIFSYRGSWCSEGRPTSWNAEWKIIGTTGSVSWDGEEKFDAVKVRTTGAFLSDLTPLEIPPAKDSEACLYHFSAIREMLSSMKSGKAPSIACQDNIKSLAMVCAAIEASETNKPVEIRL